MPRARRRRLARQRRKHAWHSPGAVAAALASAGLVQVGTADSPTSLTVTFSGPRRSRELFSFTGLRMGREAYWVLRRIR